MSVTAMVQAFRFTVGVKTYMITNGTSAGDVYLVIYMGTKKKTGRETCACWGNKTVIYLEDKDYRFITSLDGW